MEYVFRLTYHLPSSESDVDALVERLGEAGCDDALVGVGVAGRLSLEFMRAAPSAQEAVESALRDVAVALPSAQLIEVSPDLVGISDLAELTGVTRQNIRKLLVNHAETAPPPVHAGTSSLWHLSDILTWLRDRCGYEVSADTLEVARCAERVNLARETRRIASAALAAAR